MMPIIRGAPLSDWSLRIDQRGHPTDDEAECRTADREAEKDQPIAHRYPFGVESARRASRVDADRSNELVQTCGGQGDMTMTAEQGQQVIYTRRSVRQA